MKIPVWPQRPVDLAARTASLDENTMPIGGIKAVLLRKHRIAIALATAGVAALIQAPVALAFFGDMMNPGKWMGGNNDNDDYYDDDRYGSGPYGHPGAFGGPYGGYGGPYGGYGGPYGGYGAPYGGYGAPYGAAPGWLPPASSVPSPVAAPPAAAPASSKPAAPDAKATEIDALKRRIEELESRQAPVPVYAPPPSGERGGATSPPPGAGSWGSQAPPPSFRPMDKF